LTLELKKYLFDERIAMEKFSYEDVIALKLFFKTERKMRNLLEDAGAVFKAKGLYHFNVKTPTLYENMYVFNFGDVSHSLISLGFADWWGEHPCLLAKIYIQPKVADSKSMIKNAFVKLQGFNKQNEGGEYPENWNRVNNDQGIEKRKKVLDFLDQNEDIQRKMMLQFFEDCIDNLGVLKGDFPKIFKPEGQQATTNN
jgi:hypothetical protein